MKFTARVRVQVSGVKLVQEDNLAAWLSNATHLRAIARGACCKYLACLGSSSWYSISRLNDDAVVLSCRMRSMLQYDE